MESGHKKLYRSRKEHVIAGVAGGMGDYFGIDPVVVRVVFLLLALASMGFAFVFYLVLIFAIPKEPGEDVPVDKKAKIQEVAKGVREGVQAVASNIKEKTKDSKRPLSDKRNVVGILFIIIGVIAILNQVFPGYRFEWHLFWPGIVILLGLYVIFSGGRKP